ncbi:MAG: D-sedoheptulose 7-phosphate isomerase [Psychrosphaera sp.]|jgi:D-sedoheptulose 7-phosphate isomerase|uniref:SIS domain-containing protein n=1 Tax=Psychrosphaera aquimarina TaxID=2044854 RepID=A0ABU3QY04_9GAMM|nr:MULTISPECIES: SIS domain-containing protein [Psychrosphaera]MBU2918325.1 SIS domain-containing protein [Psychrosphaera sp. F3M07]MDU0112321.1 SIS domain-containing protein [Psychrosphaera aquimarina]
MFDLKQCYADNLKQHLELFNAMEKYLPVAETLAIECFDALGKGGKIVFFGNGGSAADSQHLAAEFVVRFKKERRALASMALTTDTSILTAHANDYHFDTVFARQVEALVKPEDVVIGLTTSGTSANINLALEAANDIGAYTVALTGRDGGQVKDIAKLPIIIENNITARIQEAHMFIGHWLCEAIDELVTQ